MKIYIVKNNKTKEILKISEKNKNGLALLFNTALANWEMKGSQEWKKYCEKYPTMQEYDMHLDKLEELERKEFFSNLVENNNKYNVLYQIVKVKETEIERA
jgi:hypothetical protein